MNNFSNIFNLNLIPDFQNIIKDSGHVINIFGFSTTNKEMLVKTSVAKFKQDYFAFTLNCFSYTTINDILLNLYDDFRTYIQNKNIAFKKSLKENFSEKILEYFSCANFNSVIILKDFDDILNQGQILDFLQVLSKLQNVQLILITKNRLFTGLNVSDYIQADEYSELYIREKTTSFAEELSKEEIEFLHMAYASSPEYFDSLIYYHSMSGILYKNLIEEYKKKENKPDFKEFIVNKIFHLVLSPYQTELNKLALLPCTVSYEFLATYGLVSTETLNYLIEKFIILNSSDEYFLPKIISRYLTSKLTYKEKISLYSTILEALEAEIAKSPKHRLIRLSRETIRKIIEEIKKVSPPILSSNVRVNPNFSYLGLEAQKMIKKQGAPKGGMFDVAAEDEEEIVQSVNIEELLKEAQENVEKFQYDNALNMLKATYMQITEKEDIQQANSLLAICHEKMGNKSEAVKYLKNNLKYEKKLSSNAKYKTMLKIGQMTKGAFDYEGAKEVYKEIAGDNNAPAPAKFISKFQLFDIYELQGEEINLLEKYLELYTEIKNSKYSEDFSARCSYKIATLYDNKQDTENAQRYYEVALAAARDEKDTNYAGYSCLALADIWESKGEDAKSKFYLAQAIDKLKESKNYDELFEVYRKMANYFEYRNKEKAFEYLTLALDASKNTHDAFKETLALVDMGDYYYSASANTMALKNYFEAKKLLGSEDDANAEKINSRIEDMQHKMTKDEFEAVACEY